MGYLDCKDIWTMDIWTAPSWWSAPERKSEKLSKSPYSPNVDSPKVYCPNVSLVRMSPVQNVPVASSPNTFPVQICPHSPSVSSQNDPCPQSPNGCIPHSKTESKRQNITWKYVYGYMVMVGEGLYCLLSSFHPVIKHGIIAGSIYCQLYAVLKAVVKEDLFSVS